MGARLLTMCELHPFKCTTCAIRWTVHRKLASCESPEPEARCPDNLCMYVGSPRRPRQGECEICVGFREILEEELEGNLGMVAGSRIDGMGINVRMHE
jgi:hypothetical protein